MQWNINIVHLFSNICRSLTLDKYISSGPLAQLGLSQRCKIKSVVQPTIIASLLACKKVAQTVNSCLKYSINILPITDHAHSKHLEVTFTCPNLYQHLINQVTPSTHSLDIANVEVPCPGSSYPLEHAHPEVFQSTFNFHKFKNFQHTKNPAISSL